MALVSKRLFSKVNCFFLSFSWKYCSKLSISGYDKTQNLQDSLLPLHVSTQKTTNLDIIETERNLRYWTVNKSIQTLTGNSKLLEGSDRELYR